MLCKNCLHEKGSEAVCPYCGCDNSPDTDPHHLPAGTVINNRYLVGRVLGEGGFGITYIALDQTLDVPVAVKEYFPYGISHRNNTFNNTVSISKGEHRDFYEKGKQKFLSEAKTVARLRNEPGIVNVSDFIEENNTAYIVMEYLDGVDLRQYLRKNGRLSVEETLRLLLPVIRSLDKIHATGVIHRDISPDNLMVLKNGSVKLMDFGAAREFVYDERSMSVMLKRGYAPVEQYRRDGKQGPWTDVYAICATIYRCITGKTPDESLDRLFEDKLQKPSALGVAISPAAEDALMYGLAVKKEDRCPNMAELYRRLSDAAASAPVYSPPREPLPPYSAVNPDPNATVYAEAPVTDYQPPAPAAPAPTAPAPASAVAYPSEPANKARSSKPAIIIIVIAAVLAIVGVALVVLKPFSGSKSQNSSASYSTRIDDSAELMRDNEKKELSVSVNNLSQNRACNAAVVTVNDLSNAPFRFNGTTKDYADCCYEYFFGADTDGVLVLLVLSDENGGHSIHISTTGNCIDRITDNEIDQILDNAVSNHNPDNFCYYDFLNSIVTDLNNALKY